MRNLKMWMHFNMDNSSLRLPRPVCALIAFAWASTMTAVFAQPATVPASANTGAHDAQNAALSVPPVVYRSAFENYRPFTAESVRPWRDSNNTVGDVGGWRTYLRESQQGATNPAPSAKDGGTPPPAALPISKAHQHER
jgi:hypothetical protein